MQRCWKAPDACLPCEPSTAIRLMKLAIYSDLHLEFRDWTPPPLQADVIVLGGDIHIGDAAFAWARRHFPSLPVVYVAGNHEFFGADMPTVLDKMRAASTKYDIHFLHNGSLQIQGVRFLGTTLWTDFEFYGADPACIARSIADARRGMRDYALIEHAPGQPLSPELTRQIHVEQRRWLTTELERDCEEPTVVVTHHLPHRRSVHPKYEHDPLNPAFVSDLGHLFRDSVKLWVHGHTHESCDFTIGATRVVCNPRGYLPHQPNDAFNPALVVEIDTTP